MHSLVNRPAARRLAATAMSAALAGAGLFIDASPARADFSDEDLLAECRGENPISNVEAECNYVVGTVKVASELVRKGISNAYVDNCNFDTEATLTINGQYTRTRNWSVGTEVGLNYGAVSVTGGGTYGEGEENSHTVEGSWPIPGRMKAQGTYGQPHEVSDGIMQVTAWEYVGEWPTESHRDIPMTDVRVPQWDRQWAMGAEVAACDQNFPSPVGDGEYAPGV